MSASSQLCHAWMISMRLLLHADEHKHELDDAKQSLQNRTRRI